MSEQASENQTIDNSQTTATSSKTNVDRSKATIKWLKSQKNLTHGKLSRAIALGSFNGLLMILQMAILANIINDIIFASQTFQQIIPLITALIIIVIVRAISGYLSERYSRHAAILIKTQLREQLLQRLFVQGPSKSQHKTAELAQVLHQGVDSLEDYFAGYLPTVAYCSVIPTAILFAVFPMDWKSGLVMLCTAPMVPMFMIIIGHKAQDLNQKHWRKLLRMSSHFLDIIQGLTQLKLFNASRQELIAVKKISEDYGKQTMSILKVAFLSSFVLEFLASIAIALVAVILGFRLYYGHVDYTLALWVLLLAPEFYLPFRQLGTQYHAKMAGATAAESIIDILQADEIETETELKSENEGETQRSEQPVNNSALKAPFNIEINHVNFTHPGRKNTLTDINLTCSGSGLYAIVGESGAGKSTLIDMLLGFIKPNSGQVRINDMPLTSASRDTWLQHCGWIAQQGHVFYGDLAFNIHLNSDDKAENIDQSAIEAALAKAGLRDFLSNLPQGLQTHIGEAGVGISAGQAQRLALARAFYHQPDVLILDEPSSHLDRETELIINQSITEYAQQHLVIVIAHRLTTVQDAKQIIVLKQGAIIEQGNHQQLVELAGEYASMVNPELAFNYLSSNKTKQER